MQKFTFSQIIREELVRACVFVSAFFVLLTSGFVGIAYAASSGGIFGDILNLILVKTWDDPTNDGTVKNANNLGGDPAASYAKLGVNRTCGATQCIYGIDASGNVMCH